MIRIKYLGEQNFSYRHGDLSIGFAPGASQEVPLPLAEKLLNLHVRNAVNLKGGAIERVAGEPLFEKAEVQTFQTVVDTENVTLLEKQPTKKTKKGSEK